MAAGASMIVADAIGVSAGVIVGGALVAVVPAKGKLAVDAETLDIGIGLEGIEGESVFLMALCLKILCRRMTKGVRPSKTKQVLSCCSMRWRYLRTEQRLRCGMMKLTICYSIRT